MRITQRSMQAGVAANLQGALGRMNRIQQQLSSGKLISRPSDSPTGTIAALQFRADIRRSEQLKRNADDALGRLNTADRALTDQIALVNRANQLVLQGRNASSSAEAREALAQEVEQLREQALATANTTYLGRPLFAGTTAGDRAYDATTGGYVGNDDHLQRTVAPNVTVPVGVTGHDAFGPDGADLFQVLADVADHLRNDPSALGADLDALDAAFSRLTNAVATLGSRSNQVTVLQERVAADAIEATNGLAEVESVDLPATIVKLEMQEVAYQAALAATSRVIQPSLVDFLR